MIFCVLSLSKYLKSYHNMPKASYIQKYHLIHPHCNILSCFFSNNFSSHRWKIGGATRVPPPVAGQSGVSGTGRTSLLHPCSSLPIHGRPRARSPAPSRDSQAHQACSLKGCAALVCTGSSSEAQVARVEIAGCAWRSGLRWRL